MGERFSVPVRTGPEAHPASSTVGTESFPGVKRPGRGVGHPPPSNAEVKERVELYIYFPSDFVEVTVLWNLKEQKGGRAYVLFSCQFYGHV